MTLEEALFLEYASLTNRTDEGAFTTGKRWGLTIGRSSRRNRMGKRYALYSKNTCSSEQRIFTLCSSHTKVFITTKTSGERRRHVSLSEWEREMGQRDGEYRKENEKAHFSRR
jgi:hypothetical protein